MLSLSLSGPADENQLKISLNDLLKADQQGFGFYPLCLSLSLSLSLSILIPLSFSLSLTHILAQGDGGLLVLPGQGESQP